jgi:hypothetical protein
MIICIVEIPLVMSRERTDSGQYAETVTIDRVRQVFSTVAGPAVTSADIVSELGVTAEAARRKLNEFHDRGMLGKRKTAGRNIYWLQPAGDVTDINPEDPVWGTDPITGDETVSEADIDDVLYGEIDG